MNKRIFCLAAFLASLGACACAQAQSRADVDAALAIGHMNPDTDSIISAIAVADLNSRRGIPCI